MGYILSYHGKELHIPGGAMRMRDALRELIESKWLPLIAEGTKAGRPVRLPTWPACIPLHEIATASNFVGRGLGYDVFHLPDMDLVFKVAMDRDQRVIDESFIDNQCESYLFWRSHLGNGHVPQTFLFAFPHTERPGNRGCEIQGAVTGKPLWEISGRYLRQNPPVALRLQVMIERILTAFAKTGRIPDVVGCHESAPILLRCLRSARLTSNIRLDEHGNPWLVDVGAWPRGFSVHVASRRRRIMIFKLVWDLRRMHASLCRYAMAPARG